MRIHNQKRTLISNHLQKRLIALTLCITLGVGVLFSTVCSLLYRNYLESALIRSTNTNLKFLSDSIDHNLDYVTQLVRFAQANTVISKYISAYGDDRSYSTAAVAAHERLTEEYHNNTASPYLQRIIIANHYGRFIQVVPATYSTSQNLARVIPELPYFESLLQSKEFDFLTGFVKDTFYYGTSNYVLPVIRPIYAKYRSSITGWIYIGIREELFTAPLQYYSCAEDAGLFLILGSHCYRLTEQGLIEITTSFSLDASGKQKITAVNDGHPVLYLTDPDSKEKSICVSLPLSVDGCYIAQTLSNIEYKDQYYMFAIIWAIIFALMLFVDLILTYALHRMIAVPISKLQQQMTKVSIGDFTPNPSIEWNNEFGVIGHGINTLSSDIETLLETRIADEKEKKDLEYRVLQNQINPHFLYNTLNSIKWMASIQGADGIADMITSLSRLLRSIAKGTKLQISIADELALTKDYFNIQNYRYGNTMQLLIDCRDDELLSCSILKFTLQPIVENAIFHGLEPKNNTGCIRITIQEEPGCTGNHIELIVLDDGVGIPPEKIANLLNSNADAAPEFFREIGVSNVHKRLQYEYGEYYGIHMESVLNQYTAAHIVIPKNFNEQNTK